MRDSLKIDTLGKHADRQLRDEVHLGQSIQEWTKNNCGRQPYGLWSALGRPYHFKFFKGCLPQILLGPFLNTLSHLFPMDFTLVRMIFL